MIFNAYGFNYSKLQAECQGLVTLILTEFIHLLFAIFYCIIGTINNFAEVGRLRFFGVTMLWRKVLDIIIHMSYNRISLFRLRTSRI